MNRPNGCCGLLEGVDKMQISTPDAHKSAEALTHHHGHLGAVTESVFFFLLYGSVLW